MYSEILKGIISPVIFGNLLLKADTLEETHQQYNRRQFVGMEVDERSAGMTFLIVTGKMFRLLQIYKSIVRGVAFIPLTAMLALAILALFLTLSPAVSSINSFVYSGGYFEIRTPETARAILSSILTGLISLTVFGFSMMIVVVNQAASNYSPKVVESLIGDRSNQYILGVNLGSIVFSLIVMMHVDNKKVQGGIPELAILVAVLLTIYCLLLFVRFINNISNSVRIDNIIRFIHHQTKRCLGHRGGGAVVSSRRNDFKDWTEYTAEHSGYFQMFRKKRMLHVLRKEGVSLKIIPLRGTYYLSNEPLFSASKELSREVADQLRAEFVTYYGEPIDENPVYGFRQLREIAVKALSPGINDPGVAILCIEHLAELLSLQLNREAQFILEDKDSHCVVVFSDYDFGALLDLSLLPIMWYGRRDIILLTALLHAVHQIAVADKQRRVRDTLSDYLVSLVAISRECASDIRGRKMLDKRIAELQSLGYFDAFVLDGSSGA